MKLAKSLYVLYLIPSFKLLEDEECLTYLYAPRHLGPSLDILLAIVKWLNNKQVAKRK